MKRIHIGIKVDDIDRSVDFYRRLFGIQLDSPEALESMREHIDAAGLPRKDQDDLVCGYQHQHKSWLSDPQGAMWEVFFTSGVDASGRYGCAELPED